MGETIQEFGSEAGMPQPTKFVGTTYQNIIIWEEYEPIGTQNLGVQDIIEEIKQTPEVIKNYITAIILSPYNHPNPKIDAFASQCELLGHIIIYGRSNNIEELKSRMRSGTLRHEAGHIIDRKINPDWERFSWSTTWRNAQKHDARIGKGKFNFPINWVPGNAEKYSKEYSIEWGLEEDFADSVKFYSGNEALNTLLKIFYPNRNKILRKYLNDGRRSNRI